MKEFRASIPNRAYPFLCICTALVLSGCNVTDRNHSSENTDASTVVGGEIGRSPEKSDASSSNDTASSAAPMVIELTWQANPGQIDGYMVHTGPTPESATTVITVTPKTTVKYDAAVDLGLSVGDQACFRIKAYNAEGQSDFSDAVCYLIST